MSRYCCDLCTCLLWTKRCMCSGQQLAALDGKCTPPAYQALPGRCEALSLAPRLTQGSQAEAEVGPRQLGSPRAVRAAWRSVSMSSVITGGSCSQTRIRSEAAAMPFRAVPELSDALPSFHLRLACLPPREGNLGTTGCARAQTQHNMITVYLVMQPMGIMWGVCRHCDDTGHGYGLPE